VQAGQDANGGGTIVNASRSVLYASSGSDWQTAARAEAQRLRDAINAARSASGATAPR
jgi:orotidine-5'-phosphate decarboxylase